MPLETLLWCFVRVCSSLGFDVALSVVVGGLFGVVAVATVGVAAGLRVVGGVLLLSKSASRSP